MPTFARTHGRLLLCCALGAAGAGSRASEPEAAAPRRAPSVISVIELPPPVTGLPGGARQRSHHALSIATDAPKPLLRSLGLDATDCSLRFRLPTRIKSSRETASGLSVELQAQAGLGCRF